MNIMTSTTAVSPAIQRKRVLLVDTHGLKRDLRARIMRKLGVEVDCAADIGEARSLWNADSYSLVLLDVRNDLTSACEFCDETLKLCRPDIRDRSPSTIRTMQSA